MALTFIASFIRIPIPSLRWHFHLGDTVIFIVSLLFGPIAGGISGAIGSSLADLYAGLTIWVPFSLVIKGLEGFVVGWMSHEQEGKTDFTAVLMGSLLMIGGYAIATLVLFGWPALIYEVPVDVIQCVVAVTLSLFLVKNIRKRFPIMSKIKGYIEWKNPI
ncbi:MAG: ECF transporter S component [Candidatus Atribacteria bacterium]|nr:ECF transporter S component [Candidatus Atribacteria bacterium]